MAPASIVTSSIRRLSNGDFERQSRASSSTAIFSLDEINWGVGISGAAHSPALGRERKEIKRRPHPSRMCGDNYDNLQESSDEKKSRNGRHTTAPETVNPLRRENRRNSEPRLIARRGLGKGGRNRRQKGAEETRSMSPRNRRRGHAAAASTALAVSRKEIQRSSSHKTKRSNRRTPQNIDQIVDMQLTKSLIKW
jgi:hypothetical protein